MDDPAPHLELRRAHATRLMSRVGQRRPSAPHSSSLRASATSWRSAAMRAGPGLRRPFAHILTRACVTPRPSYIALREPPRGKPTQKPDLFCILSHGQNLTN